MGRKQPKRVGYGWLFAVLALVMGVYIVASNHISGQKELLISQESAARVTLSRLETERAALEREIALAGTDAYIENLARTQYGFLKPGEIRFEITNPEVLYETAGKAQIQVIEE